MRPKTFKVKRISSKFDKSFNLTNNGHFMRFKEINLKGLKIINGVEK